MAASSAKAGQGGTQEQRIEIRYFDGVNATVSPQLAKKTELSHAENARTPLIGVLEKRQGQAKTGTAANGGVFLARGNYGLVKFPNDLTSNKGVFRISASSEPTVSRSVSVSDDIRIMEPSFSLSFSSPSFLLSMGTQYQVFAIENISISEPSFFSRLDNSSVIVDGTSEAASIYTLTTSDTWAKLSDSDATNIIGAPFSFANVEGDLILVNQKDYNRFLSSDGVTVGTSATAGSLYNSPRSAKVAFYKSRIYLADFIREGVRYKTTVLRSSFPLGIVALVNGDALSHASGSTLAVTDTKYFYAASGMNQYDIYRGGTLITTITVTLVNETSVTVTHSGTPNINSSDEIWVAGTFNGEKQFRWVNNATSVGASVKQYDTFRLAGGDEDEITLLEPIGNVLLVANKNALMTWNDYTLENFDLGIGCVSPRGYTKLLGTLFFLHYSGVFTTSGSMPKLISRKVERYIRGATKQGLENAAAGFKGLSVFFSIGDSTLYNPDGSLWKVLEDVCLEYSIADENWYVHTNVPAEEFETFIDTTGAERLLMSHSGNEKSIKEFLTGNTDDGNEIFMRVDSQPLDLMKEFEVYGNPLRVVTDMDRGALVKCFIALDSEDFYELQGTVGKGPTSLKVNAKDPKRVQPPLARKVRISYRDSSKQLCRLMQASIVYLPTTLENPE